VSCMYRHCPSSIEPGTRAALLPAPLASLACSRTFHFENFERALELKLARQLTCTHAYANSISSG
jgi:hypothetical protein